MNRRKPVRKAVRALARTAPFAALVSALERVAQTRPHLLAALTYHRVAEPHERRDLDPQLISATPAEFRAQLDTLARTHQFVTLDDVLAARRGESRLPARALLLTFDDAYVDFAEHAWPTLREAGVPVTLFVPTDFPADRDRAFWWDSLHAATALGDVPVLETPVGAFPLETDRDRASAAHALSTVAGDLQHEELLAFVENVVASAEIEPPRSSVLGWNELRALAHEGVTLAPHSCSHPRLDRVPISTAWEEIVGSRAALLRETGAAAPAFAYPGGGYTREVVDVVAESGFELAFTTQRGADDIRSADWLTLHRINVGRTSTASLVRAQLVWFANAPRAVPAVGSGR